MRDRIIAFSLSLFTIAVFVVCDYIGRTSW
jgi:hypothetical protein